MYIVFHHFVVPDQARMGDGRKEGRMLVAFLMPSSRILEPTNKLTGQW